MAINRLLLVLGLLASAGNLVHARFYRGGADDYTSNTHASTEVYVGGEYAEDNYDYNLNTKRTGPGSLDWVDSDYPWSMDRTNPGSLDWAGYDNIHSTEQENPGSLDWAGYDNTRSMEPGNFGLLDSNVEER